LHPNTGMLRCFALSPAMSPTPPPTPTWHRFQKNHVDSSFAHGVHIYSGFTGSPIQTALANSLVVRPCTGPETICPGTSKLAYWRVQLSTATKVGRRGAGSATASIEASLLAGDISHPPAQMIPFMLADELCRPPAQKV
jgi:hypothetical protein